MGELAWLAAIDAHRALAALQRAAAGASLDDPALVASGARRLLAHGPQPHWIATL